MTVTLTLGADPDRRDEQNNLPAAVAVLSPGETLSVTPGVWPGDVTFPSGANVVGSGRDNTILPGKLVFPGGGNLKNLDLPESSFLVYGGGLGDVRNLYMDGDAVFNSGTLTGDNVLSRTGDGTVTVTVGGGVSLRLTNVTLGPIALGGTSFLINSVAFALGLGGGTAVITNVAVGSTVSIAAGQMTMTNVTVKQSMTINPEGSAIIPRNVVIG